MKITDFYPSLLAEAKLSKDPHRQICAAAYDWQLNRIASGWNGIPRKVLDLPERYNRPLKDFFLNHAEINLIANAARVGAKLEGCSILITELQPCAGCAAALTQAGIVAVWYPVKPTSGKTVRKEWLENFQAANQIFNEAGVQLCPFDL